METGGPGVDSEVVKEVRRRTEVLGGRRLNAKVRIDGASCSEWLLEIATCVEIVQRKKKKTWTDEKMSPVTCLVNKLPRPAHDIKGHSPPITAELVLTSTHYSCVHWY